MRWRLAIERVDQELVDRAPGVVVGRARDARERGARHDLPPEEAVQVLGARLPRQHAVDHVEVLPAVAVEVERVGRPGPAAHLGAGLERRVLEAPVAAVAEERVAPRVVAVERPHLGRGIGHEGGRRRHAQAVVAPHVAGVDVELSVVVVVEEGRAHAGAVVEDARLRGDVLEASPCRRAARGCGRGSWSRSRSRPAGPASRRRRSRPRPRRSGSGRCPTSRPASCVTSTNRPWPSLRKSTPGGPLRAS